MTETYSLSGLGSARRSSRTVPCKPGSSDTTTSCNRVVQKLYPAEIYAATEVPQIMRLLQSFAKYWVLLDLDSAQKDHPEVPL